MITCCKGCDRRSIGCHGVCDDYRRQKAEHDKVVDAKRKLAMTNAGLYEHRSQAIRKTSRIKLGGG